MNGARKVISTVSGLALLSIACAAALARYAQITDHLTLYAVVASPYAMWGAPVALAILLWGRRWVLAAFSACLCAVLVTMQLPYYTAATPNPDSVRVRAMTVNLMFGHADPDDVTSIARECADVMTVQELTPEAVQALSATGIGDTFPYQALEARSGAAGVGIYSRYPLAASRHIDGFAMAMVSTDIRIPGAARQATAVAAHFTAPWPQSVDGWHSDMTKFPRTLDSLAAEAGGGAVIVGGDFNSTVDMQPFRRLLDNGYDDAADQAGAGRELTYPSNGRLPALIGIDHILTRNSTAVSLKSVRVAGTDHRALIAEVDIPAG